MVAHPFRFWQASYELESGWAELTSTFGTRLQLTGPPTINFLRDNIPVPISQQYAEEGIANIPGIFGGTFSVQLYLTGHGGSTVAALTATDLYTLLLNFFGAGDATQVGDSSIDSVTDATQFVAAAGTFNSHGIIRVGDLGDGRAEGQAAVVNVGATTTLLTALPSAPQAADAAFVMLGIFPDERPGSLGTIASTRWNLMSANNQWSAHGCFPMTAEFAGLSHGETPVVTLTYGVSRFVSKLSDTFPDVTATAAKTASVVNMGSVFINDVGTATRQIILPRSLGVTINQEVQPTMCPGGLVEGQVITGATRTRCNASLNMQVDADAAGTEFFADLYDAGTLQHILLNLGSGDNAADGKYLAWYFQNAKMVGPRPTQVDGDGLNRVDVQFEALSGATVTNAQTIASWALGIG